MEEPKDKPAKINFNYLIWDQCKYLPKEGRFFYISPEDSFTQYVWREAGHMRGSSGIEDINLKNPFRFSSDEKKLRAEAITAASFLELIIEGLVYLSFNVYDTDINKTAKAVNELISDKVEKRVKWLALNELVDTEVVELAQRFFAFRNSVAHSYTFRSIKYNGDLITGENWAVLSKRIERDYTLLAQKITSAYSNNQFPVINMLLESIRNGQRNDKKPLTVSGFFTNHHTVEQIDLRHVDHILDKVDISHIYTK